VPINFAVTGTAAKAFPKGVLARKPTSEAFRKPRRFIIFVASQYQILGLTT